MGGVAGARTLTGGLPWRRPLPPRAWLPRGRRHARAAHARRAEARWARLGPQKHHEAMSGPRTKSTHGLAVQTMRVRYGDVACFSRTTRTVVVRCDQRVVGWERPPPTHATTPVLRVLATQGRARPGGSMAWAWCAPPPWPWSDQPLPPSGSGAGATLRGGPGDLPHPAAPGAGDFPQPAAAGDCPGAGDLPQPAACGARTKRGLGQRVTASR